MDKKNSQVFSAVAVPMSVAVVVVVVMVVAAGIMCFVANGGEGGGRRAATHSGTDRYGSGTRRPCRQRYAFPVRIPGCKPGADKGGA